MIKPDWNTLIQRYTTEKPEHILDRRYELWICGYIPQAQILADLVRQRPAKVLDFGCGNGRMCRFLNRWHGYEAIGIDISEVAVKRAQLFSDDLQFHLIEPDTIPDELGRFDACVCNQVFPTYSSLSDIKNTLRTIRQALEPGAPVLIYVDNTNYTAVRYTSFMAGVPGAHYESGDPLPMEIYLGDEVVMQFEDYYWSPKNYLDTLTDAGFRDVSVRYPTPTTASRATYESYFNVPVEAALSVEAELPPAAIYIGRA